MHTNQSPVLITGAARRLGAAIARSISKAGHPVLLHVRRTDDDAQALMRLINEEGGRCQIIEGDLTDVDALEDLFAQAVAAFGHVDHLINNASHFSRLSIEETTLEDFNSLMALHNSAPFFLSRSLYLHLKERAATGSIINIVDATLPNPKASRPAYYTAKGALLAQSRALSIALGPTVRVNAISPGPILQGEEDEPYFERMTKRLPVKRIGDPQDICQAVQYLLDATFVTGAELVVDGGLQRL